MILSSQSLTGEPGGVWCSLWSLTFLLVHGTSRSLLETLTLCPWRLIWTFWKTERSFWTLKQVVNVAIRRQVIFSACICHWTYITLSHTWVLRDLLFSVASPLYKWMVHILIQRRTDKYNLPVLNNFIILLKKGAKYRWKCRYNFKMWQYSWTTKWIYEGKLQILQWQKYLGSLLWPELSLVSCAGLYCFGDFSCPNAVNSIAWTWFRQMHSCLHELSARKKMVWSDRTRTWSICP